MRKLTSLLFTGVVGLAALAGSARADIFIDNFSATTAGTFPITRTSAGASTTTENGLAGVIGGQRVTTLNATTASATDPLVANIILGNPGAVDYAAATGASGSLTLSYNGNGTLNTDLTQGGLNSFIRVGFVAYDFPANTPLPVTMTVTSGATTRSVTRNYAQAGPGDLNFAFNDPGLAGVNFAAVNAISFTFAPTVASSDFRLNFLAASAIPEPSPVLLGLIGLAGAFAARKARTLWS